MKILDKDIDFDLNEAENIDRLKQLDKNYGEEIKKTDSVTEMCLIYKKFFDEALGDGTSQLLFGEKNNYRQMLKAYKELLQELEKYLKEFTAETEKMQKKFERYL